MPLFDHLIRHTSFPLGHRVTTPPFQPASLVVMLVDFELGQDTPEHPGPSGAFYVVDGQGWMSIGGERQEIQAGAVAIAPQGAQRNLGLLEVAHSVLFSLMTVLIFG